MRVVIPDPALGVRGGSEHVAAGAQNAVGFADERHRIGNMLEHVLEYDCVECAVGERELLIGIAEDRVASERNGLRHRISRAVDARVVRKVLSEPGRAAADVEQRCVGREVARDVAVVPRLLVPVEIAHEGAYRSICALSVPEHVALNALFLAPGVSGGPETYLRGLAPALASEFPELRLTVVTTRSGAAFLRELGFADFAEVRAVAVEDGQRVRRALAEQLLLPRIARGTGAQLIHSLASTAPLYPRLPAVITLHDLTFMRTRTFGVVTTFGMRHVIVGAARRADVLLVGTAAARDEICETVPLDPARFIVVHHGRGRSASPHPASEDELRSRYRLERARVVLCVGAKRPHKNQEVLIRAATQLDSNVVLMLVGHAEPYETRLRAIAAELGIADRIRFVEPVADGELEGIWRVADCFAFPTLGEGFGLPLLEAMEHRLSVACSDLPVLREVGGELPFFFDPHSPDDAARAIRLALGDTARAAHGPAHAAQFSWSNSARGTYAGYERALAVA